MKDAAKSKVHRPSKRKKIDEKRENTIAQISADPVPEVTVLRPSTAEKLRLKSQLKEECFSVPMEAEIPIYRWYVNTLPKEEEDMEFSGMFPTEDCQRLNDELKEEEQNDDMISHLLLPQDGLSSPIKDEPQDDYDYQVVGTHGQFVMEDALEGQYMGTFTTDLARENEALKAEITEMRKENNDRMVNLITRASDSHAMDQARIEELTLKLAQCEGLLQQLHQVVPRPLPPLLQQQQPQQLPESLPSSEVIELQHKLKKLQLEAAFHSACRETEKRIMKEMEKKLEDAEKKLEGAARREMNAFHENRELAREKDRVTAQLDDARTRIDELTIELADAVKKQEDAARWEGKAHFDCRELAREKEDLERRLVEVSTRFEEARRSAENEFNEKTELARQMEVLSRDTASLKSEIELGLVRNRTLRQRLAEYEGRLPTPLMQSQSRGIAGDSPQRLLQPLLQQQLLMLLPPPVLLPPTQLAVATLPPERITETAVRALALTRGVKLHEIGHPTNIFKPCLPDPNESTFFHSACWELGSIALNMDSLQFTDNCVNLHNMDAMTLHCDLCEKTLIDFGIIEHFLSSRHIREMFSLGAAVSSAALGFWVDTLQTAPAAAVAKRPMQQSVFEILEIDQEHLLIL